MKKISAFFSLVLIMLLWSNFLYAQKFEVSYTDEAFRGNFSGKVLLYLSKDSKEPKNNDFIYRINPYFAVDVKNIKPGQKIIINDRALSFPVKISEIERGEYFVQAVWDRNLGGRVIGRSPGNMFSVSSVIIITADKNKSFLISCNQVITEKTFINTASVKEIKIVSALLTTQQGKPATIAAAVILPKMYNSDTLKKFPLYIGITGFGGDYHNASGKNGFGKEIDSVQYITVNLDGNCSAGLSGYANSENNGPWGDALVKELLPEIDKQFRCNGFRAVNGHSSGGWAALWLQTHYPETFHACWASSPDPVDFRSFLSVNLYEDDNMFYNKDGEQQPVTTLAGSVPLTYMKDNYQMEAVQYRGCQMHSFDAVFSNRKSNGDPESICDAGTGKINKEVAEYWKQYDISLYLRNNWATLESLLHNKILITVGDQDNFLLNHAVHMMDAEMKKLNAPVEFGYFPGDHFTVLANKDYGRNGNRFLAQCYRNWLNKNQ
jgi:S-formylglutathione hydrolase FrmB